MNQEEKWLLLEKHKGEEGDAFQSDLARLRSGEPLAYIIGHVPFLDCRIHLDSKPLIPRPETEYWVAKVIETISPNSRVLDLCAGSGCIGVGVAKAIPEAQVTFAELDPAHVQTIEKNIAANLSDGERFKAVQTDLFENVTGTYDFILSNPPYIDPSIDRTEYSVKEYEPHLALYGGQGGMEIIRRIIEAAPEYLAKGGQLWLEHEPEQVEAIRKVALATGFNVATHNDQYEVQRFSILTH